MVQKKLVVASDHAGLAEKSRLAANLSQKGHDVCDLGPCGAESVDYPDYASLLADHMLKYPVDYGILLCGSGIGMSIAANRHPHIRAALLANAEMAKLSRQHNDANVAVFGARVTQFEVIEEALDAFLATDFEGGRHQRRVEKLTSLPENFDQKNSK